MSSTVQTNNGLDQFRFSVDLTINASDLGNLVELVQKGKAGRDQFLKQWNDTKEAMK